MSLYDDLGVRRDATAAEMKRAYKAAAQKAHPDKPGGSEEAFVRIKMAFETLSDRSRRERYDRTGDSAEIDPRAECTAYIVGIFFGVIDAVDDCEHTDLLGAVRRKIEADHARDQLDLLRLETNTAKRERVLKRTRRKAVDGKSNSLALALERDIEDRKRRIELGREALAQHRLALKILAEYAYDADLLGSPLISRSLLQSISGGT